jgi:hypothetical protein
MALCYCKGFRGISINENEKIICDSCKQEIEYSEEDKNG